MVVFKKGCEFLLGVLDCDLPMGLQAQEAQSK